MYLSIFTWRYQGKAENACKYSCFTVVDWEAKTRLNKWLGLKMGNLVLSITLFFYFLRFRLIGTFSKIIGSKKQSLTTEHTVYNFPECCYFLK